MEKQKLDDILKSFKAITKYFTDIEKIKPSDQSAVEKLEKAIKKLPEPDVFSKIIHEKIDLAMQYIEEYKTESIENFKKSEAEYIREIQSKGTYVKELSNGWRVGRIVFSFRPEYCMASVLYNNEVLIDWSKVNSKLDFMELEEKANRILDNAAMPIEELQELFFEAIRHARVRNTSKGNTNLVPIKDFYKEVFLELTWKQIEKKNSIKSIKEIDFPLWKFLYNLDVYQSKASEIPVNKRLGLQTGSLQETMRGKGLVVNGLSPQSEYKVMCYVYLLNAETTSDDR